ncbi:MAG: PhzF family phenazine biosynthesis protein [Cyanobacteria bacterium P01_A01_bin.70]
MQLPIFQVDAFTNKMFGGNPAAVCPLETWLPAPVMQQIAAENALAETAFFVPRGEAYEIRWFTPEIEMDLCGHATLAAAHVLARNLNCDRPSIEFHSPSGLLTVTISETLLTLDFPSRKPEPAVAPAEILAAIAQAPIAVLKARDYLLVFEDEETIRAINPNRRQMDQINLDPGGVIVTAPGAEADFVSRFFTPQASIFEDPVTGSAHCSLIPYWSKKLGQDSMRAVQLSPREGQLFCTNAGNRVLIGGQAITYMTGEITV